MIRRPANVQRLDRIAHRASRNASYFPPVFAAFFARYASSCWAYWLSTRMIAIASTRLGANAGSAQAASITGATFSRTAAGPRWLRAAWSSTAYASVRCAGSFAVRARSTK